MPATVGGWDGGVGVFFSDAWVGPVATTAALPLTSTEETLTLAITGTGTWAMIWWRSHSSASPVPSRSMWRLSPVAARCNQFPPAGEPGHTVEEPTSPAITQDSSRGDVTLGIDLVVPIWPIEEVIDNVGVIFTSSRLR